MQRPVLFLAGVLLATGASLAMAAPASAAGRSGADHPRHNHCSHHQSYHHDHHYGYLDGIYGLYDDDLLYGHGYPGYLGYPGYPGGDDIVIVGLGH